MNITKLFILLLTLLSLNLYASDSSNDMWYGYFGKTKLSDHYSWWTEAQLRFDLDDTQTQQTLFRTGLLRKLNAQHELGFLYAYIEAGESKEHRLALQHVQQYGTFADFAASHRMRLELRTRERGTSLAERYRYLIRLQKQSERRWVPVMWNELFLNLRSEPLTGNRLVERNRLFLGYRFKKAQDFNIEVGYLNQYVPRTNNDLMEHILTVYLFI